MVDSTRTSSVLDFAYDWTGLRRALNIWVDDGGTVSPDLLVAGNSTGPTSPFGVLPNGSTTDPGIFGQTSPLDTRSPAVTVGLSGPPDPMAPLGGGNAGWMILTTEDQASAQVLPYQPRLGVYSTMNAAVPSRVFEIMGDPKTHEFAIVLSQMSGTGPPIEMIAYDASGHQIANSETGFSPDRRELSMNVPTDPLSPTSGVFVKIGAPPLPGSSSAFSDTDSESFVLQITREPETSLPTVELAHSLTPTVHLGAGSSSLAMAISPSAFESGQERSAAMPADSADAEVALGASLVVTSTSPGQQPSLSVVATGPLPERAGAPLGGVLAEGDPVPQIDRHDPALIDLALIGLPEPEPMPGLGRADPQAIVAELEPASGETEGLVTIRGPGGSPLLASSLHAQRAPASDALLAVLPPAAAIATVARPEPPGIVIPAETITQRRRKPIRTASMLSGVTVAMAFVFSLILPDASRLMTVVDAPRFRFRFRFRRRGGV